MNLILRQVFGGVLLVLAQVFLANQMVLFSGAAIPFVFLVFLLFFPTDLPRPVQYLVGFVAGFLVDWLSLQGPIGLHAFTATLLMGVRLPVIRLVGSSLGSGRASEDIRLDSQQLVWYVAYFFPLILLYVLVFVFLEAMTFVPSAVLMGKVLGTTIYTFFLCLILTYIFIRRS